MPNTVTILSFIGAALLLLIIPGPGFLYILARSLAQGRMAGFVSVLGMSTGALVHVTAATIGLSAILATSATAFGILKLLGAAYLIFLGIKVLGSRESLVNTESVSITPKFRLFTDGVLVSVLNPKIAVFFLAFLPQFVNLSLGNTSLQILILGLLFVFLATLVDALFALVAGGFQVSLRRLSKKSAWLRYISGALYILLGFAAAFVEPPSAQRNH